MPNSLPLYTVVSKSHETIYKYFLQSIDKNDYDINVLSIESVNGGDYLSNDWLKITKSRIQFLINLFEENIGKPIVNADCDILFFKGSKQELLTNLINFDMAFQDDCNGLCLGLFICVPTKEIIDLFYNIFRLIKGDKYDQIVMNQIISEYGIKYKKLGKRFYTPGFVGKGVVNSIDDFKNDIPDNILTFHANYIDNIKFKEESMRYVLEKYGKQ